MSKCKGEKNFQYNQIHAQLFLKSALFIICSKKLRKQCGEETGGGMRVSL